MKIGDKINKLYYKENLGKIKENNLLYGLFVCDCGKEVVKLLSSVRSHSVKYCGYECSLRESKRKYVHKKDGKYLCTKCNEYKEDKEFDINNSHSSKHRDYKDKRCKKCKAEQRKWNNKYDNIDRLLTSRFLGLQERAYKNLIELNVNKEYLKFLWENQKGICALSGIKMTHISGNGRTPTNVSIDRIDPQKGYVIGNIQLVCMAVNQMKSDLTEEQLFQFCKAIINQYENRNN